MKPRLCFVFEKPSLAEHPVIHAALKAVQSSGQAEVLYCKVGSIDNAELLLTVPDADLYLIKPDMLQAWWLAGKLAERGKLVINSYEATSNCKDRALMNELLAANGLPALKTRNFDSIYSMLAPEALSTLKFPLVIKSRFASITDVVRRIDTPEDVQPFLDKHGREPIVVQKLKKWDGWDLKVWVIGQRVFTASRRTKLDGPAPDFPVDLHSLPFDCEGLAHLVGRVFGLELFGMDVLLVKEQSHGRERTRPYVVDVNSLPDFGGAVGGGEALTEFLLDKVSRIASSRAA